MRAPARDAIAMELMADEVEKSRLRGTHLTTRVCPSWLCLSCVRNRRGTSHSPCYQGAVPRVPRVPPLFQENREEERVCAAERTAAERARAGSNWKFFQKSTGHALGLAAQVQTAEEESPPLQQW